MKTTFHAYSFDVRNPAEKAAYHALRAELKARGYRRFHALGSYWCPELDGKTIDLETKHLFDNQWDTASGLRVFDWAEEFQPHLRWSKRGYWLDLTTEMREIRSSTAACGYCGKQEPVALGNTFCDKCLDSEYLKENDLHLLRLRRIDDTNDRSGLSESESAELLPRYHGAQLHGSTARGKARLAKARQDIAEKRARAHRHADAEFEAATWVLDNFPGLLGNWIYYSHTGKSKFGWRKPLSETECSRLLEKISEFPGRYEINRENGKPLSS